jgi:hypothetical protein
MAFEIGGFVCIMPVSAGGMEVAPERTRRCKEVF